MVRAGSLFDGVEWERLADLDCLVVDAAMYLWSQLRNRDRRSHAIAFFMGFLVVVLVGVVVKWNESSFRDRAALCALCTFVSSGTICLLLSCVRWFDFTGGFSIFAPRPHELCLF